MSTIGTSQQQLREEGYLLLREVFSDAEMSDMIQSVEQAVNQNDTTDAIRKYEDVFGVRNAFEIVPKFLEVTRHPSLTLFLKNWFEEPPFVVKATLFNKTPNTNWGVGWHQDRTIATAERVDTPGFTNWSTKAGTTHVQPPAEVLYRMLAVRIHLDDCPEENGALKVIPGSHKQGRLDRDQKKQFSESVNTTTCEAASGDVLLMNPLLLHASAKSTTETQRRVLHLEVTSQELPGQMDWGQRVGFK